MIEQIIIISLCILGFHYCIQFNLATREGKSIVIMNKEILWWYRYYINTFLTKINLPWLKQPMSECPVCMAGPFGTVGYLVLNFGHLNIIHLCVTVLAVAGLNRLLMKLVNH
jgi:hypothetical protein